MLRLGINPATSWQSIWDNTNKSSNKSSTLNNYSKFLHNDFLTRDYLELLYTKLCVNPSESTSTLQTQHNETNRSYDKKGGGVQAEGVQSLENIGTNSKGTEPRSLSSDTNTDTSYQGFYEKDLDTFEKYKRGFIHQFDNPIKRSWLPSYSNFLEYVLSPKGNITRRKKDQMNKGILLRSTYGDTKRLDFFFKRNKSLLKNLEKEKKHNKSFFTNSFVSIQYPPKMKSVLRIGKNSASIYKRLILVYKLYKKNIDTKLILFHIKKLYEIRKRLLLIEESLPKDLKPMSSFPFSLNNQLPTRDYVLKDLITEKSVCNKLTEDLGSQQKKVFIASAKRREILNRNTCLRFNRTLQKSLRISLISLTQKQKDNTHYKYLQMRRSSYKSLAILPEELINKDPISTEKASSYIKVLLTTIISRVKKIKESLTRTYWLRYKSNINYLLINKNNLYIKTKLNRISNTISSNSGFPKELQVSPKYLKKQELKLERGKEVLQRQDLDQEPNLMEDSRINSFFSLFQSHLLVKPLRKNFSLSSSANSKNIFEHGQTYYIYILFIKVLTLNIWKSLSKEILSTSPKYKRYNFLIYNKNIKVITNPLYLKFDKLKLIDTIFSTSQLFSLSQNVPRICSSSTPMNTMDCSVIKETCFKNLSKPDTFFKYLTKAKFEFKISTYKDLMQFLNSPKKTFLKSLTRSKEEPSSKYLRDDIKKISTKVLTGTNKKTWKNSVRKIFISDYNILFFFLLLENLHTSAYIFSTFFSVQYKNSYFFSCNIAPKYLGNPTMGTYSEHISEGLMHTKDFKKNLIEGPYQKYLLKERNLTNKYFLALTNKVNKWRRTFLPAKALKERNLALKYLRNHKISTNNSLVQFQFVDYFIETLNIFPHFSDFAHYYEHSFGKLIKNNFTGIVPNPSTSNEKQDTTNKSQSIENIPSIYDKDRNSKDLSALKPNQKEIIFLRTSSLSGENIAPVNQKLGPVSFKKSAQKGLVELNIQTPKWQKDLDFHKLVLNLKRSKYFKLGKFALKERYSYESLDSLKQESSIRSTKDSKMSTTNKVLGNKYFLSDMFFHKKSSKDLTGQMMSLSNKTFLIRTSYRTKDFYQQLLPFSFLNSFLSKNLGTNNVIFSNNLTKSFLNTTTRRNAGTNSFFSFGKDNVTKELEQNNIINQDFFQQALVENKALIKTPSSTLEKLLTKVLATSGTNSFFLEEPSLFSVMSLSLEKNTSKNIQQQKPASLTRRVQTSSSYKQILTSLNKDILRTFFFRRWRKKRNLLYICTKTLPNFIPRHYGSSLSIVMGQLNRQNNLLSWDNLESLYFSVSNNLILEKHSQVFTKEKIPLNNIRKLLHQQDLGTFSTVPSTYRGSKFFLPSKKNKVQAQELTNGKDVHSERTNKLSLNKNLFRPFSLINTPDKLNNLKYKTSQKNASGFSPHGRKFTFFTDTPNRLMLRNLMSLWDIKKLDLIIKRSHSKVQGSHIFVDNLSKFVIAFMKKNKGGKNKFQQLKNITLRILSLSLQKPITNDRYLGAAFAFSGRVYGGKKAASFKIILGSVPFNTLDCHIDYSNIIQETRNGTWNFETWLHLRTRKPKLFVEIH